MASLATRKQPFLSPAASVGLHPQVPDIKPSALVHFSCCAPALQRMFATTSRRLLKPGGWAALYAQDRLAQGAHCVGEYATDAMTQMRGQSQGGEMMHNADTTPAAVVAPVPSSAAPLGVVQTERGTQFVVGPSFYKPESTPSRDLAVLAARVHQQQTGAGLRVLDVMSGCGVRGARYLDQAGVDYVWANDAWDETHAPLVANLSAASGDPWGFQGPVDAWQIRQAATTYARASEEGGRAEAELAERQRSHLRATTTDGVREDPEGPEMVAGAARSMGGLGKDGALDSKDREGRFGKLRGYPVGSEVADDGTLHREHVLGGPTSIEDGHIGKGHARLSGDVSKSCTKTSPEGTESGRKPRWRVSHLEASKLLGSCNQNGDFYDIVDIDSFGSDSAFLGDALRAVRYGGMVYVTSTDGFALAGGHRPAATLAAYGSYARPVPFGNEMGLRILVGTMVREGALRDLLVRPLFSHFAPHGPVFRAMLRVDKLNKGDWGHDDFAFLGHCFVCGQTRKAAWKQLGNITCACAGPEHPPRPMAVVGPMWTGPLHCAAFVDAMVAESGRHSWAEGLAEGYGRRPAGERHRPKGNSVYPFRDLPDLLQLMQEETQPGLPPFFYKLDDIYKLGKASPVNKLELCAELRKAGFVVSRSQVSAGAIKTNASIADCIEAARVCHVAAQRKKDQKLAARQ
ncbi:tRNA methyltransferase [Klebsormidium nitens]|uniref:tRNA methyltransferase n=1 Tax=Klebsormidium nitens TaxID=105231 RepID=A0A1Y1ISE0_KLENI|nr:tRNA methyltransferase [Klebsormidium nitens]|eukprot:GAQ91686.1 tRNA methyltransferase [Klebsormidium nitens]